LKFGLLVDELGHRNTPEKRAFTRPAIIGGSITDASGDGLPPSFEKQKSTFSGSAVCQFARWGGRSGGAGSPADEWP